MDSRGWCDPEEGKKYYQTKRTEIQDAEDLMRFCAEYCFTVEDALSLEGVNSFNKTGLAEQKSQIVVHKKGEKIQKGVFQWKFPPRSDIKKSWESVTGVQWKLSERSKIQIVEHPIRDEEGNVPKNLYVAGIDSIDIGQQDTSSETRNPSDFCIVILKRQRGLDEPKIVALYKDRPKKVKDAYIIALQLLMYYECKAVLEATRVSILNFFKERKLADKYLMRRPRATMNNVKNKMANTYGSPATQAIIKHQLELITSFTYDYPHTIQFQEVLDELLTYNYENKTHFDIVAALGMALLGDEELSTFSVIKEDKTSEWQDIGYYTDEYGRKRFGAIPNYSERILTKNNIWESVQTTGLRTSNPRFN